MCDTNKIWLTARLIDWLLVASRCKTKWDASHEELMTSNEDINHSLVYEWCHRDQIHLRSTIQSTKCQNNWDCNLKNLMVWEMMFPCRDTCIPTFGMWHISLINMMEWNVCVQSHRCSACHKCVMHHRGCMTLRGERESHFGGVQQTNVRNMNDV